MQSNNPVFRRSQEFNQAQGTQQPGQGYSGGQQTYAGYGEPAQWSTGQPGSPQGYDATRPAPAGAPMTIDSVVQKTAVTLGVVFITAFATWVLTPSLDQGFGRPDLGGLYAAMVIGSIGALVLSLVNSFKRVVNPALVLAFAAFEGVALGAFSKFIDSAFSSGAQGSLVVQAVIGTFAAFAGTLAAYKFFNIQVGQRFRTIVVAAMFGMVGLGLLELVLSLFGAQLGIYGFGALGAVFAVLGLVLGVFMLVLDFDFVEQGIRNRAPEVESWRAAFAMTVSLVWIYTNLLRLLAILNSD